MLSGQSGKAPDVVRMQWLCTRLRLDAQDNGVCVWVASEFRVLTKANQDITFNRPGVLIRN